MVKLFEKIFLRKFDDIAKDGKVDNLWEDVFLSVLSSTGRDKLLITLKADLDIIAKIVDGLSAYSISNRLGIASKNVYDVAKFWGFEVLNESLDVSSFVIYKDGMKPQTFQSVYNSITPVDIGLDVAKTVVKNLEHYSDVLYYLEESEKDDK